MFFYEWYVFFMTQFSVAVVLQGHVNPGLPLRATFSEDGRFAVCGSEDGSVHVWNAGADVETAWKREWWIVIIVYHRIS